MDIVCSILHGGLVRGGRWSVATHEYDVFMPV